MSDLKRRILETVGSDLAAIEKALADNLNPHLDLVREVAGHGKLSRTSPMTRIEGSCHTMGYGGKL